MEYLRRFDFNLAARIRRAGPAELAQLVAERLPAWRASGRAPASDVLLLASRSDRPAAAVIEELLAEGSSLTELQNDVVHDLCLQGEGVRLPELGGLAEILPADVEGALSSLDVLPGTDEEVFLLLRPHHLDQLVQTLQEAAGSLGEEAPAPGPLAALERLREACAARPGQLVAYCFEG
jgi:hypothetical protein